MNDIPGLPLSNTWISVSGCSSSDGDGLTSIVDAITITGAPGAITSIQADLVKWSLVLNDGTTAADFSIDRYDDSGALADSPIHIARADGTVSFADAVILAQDPVATMGAATRNYVDNTRPIPATTLPLMDGTASIGASFTWAMADHVHPSDTSKLSLAGGTMTGVLTVQGSNSLVLTGALGATRAILGQTAGITRWQMTLGDGTTEGVGNAGSNFNLAAFGNAGGFLFNPLSIIRATGVVTFSAIPSIPGGTGGYFLQTDGAGNCTWQPAPGAGGGISDAPSDGSYYSRRNAAWAVAPAGIADAPNDATLYARKSAGWSHVVHTDITDWTATLAPYALITSLANYLPLAGGTLTGGLIAPSLVVNGPADLKVQSVTAAATTAINRALGENVALALGVNVTSLTVSNWPAAGTTGKVRLVIVSSGAFTMSGWPAGTLWPGGTAPVITSGAGKRDIILLMSDDGGTTIYGSVVGQDYR